MPTNSIVLDKFDYGIISNPDAEDISEKAAVSSLNIDGDNEDGKLKGIPDNTEIYQSGTTPIGNIRLGKMIEKDGIYDLIYHDSSANTISAIVDFYNTNSNKKKIDLITGLSYDTVTMVLNNKEVHIGLGTSDAYWIGYCSHGLFNFSTQWDISNIAKSGSDIVVTAPSHSLKNNNLVRITGALGDFSSINAIWKVEQVDNNAGTFVLTGCSIAGTPSYTGGTDVVYQHLCIETAACKISEGTSAGQFELVIGSENAATGYFTNGVRYSWKFSLIYDGYQESPMGTAYEDTASAGADYYPIILRANDAQPVVTTNPNGISYFNKRITGINIYRADSTDGTNTNLGLYRRIASIDINSTDWITNSDEGTVNARDQEWRLRDYGNYITYPFLTAYASTLNSDLITYAENTGMPETLTDPEVNYSLSTKGNGSQFVSGSYLNSLKDVTRYIYKSKELRMDMFDWTNDFLVMPRTPTALEFYEGKLYAFDVNNMYRINPEGLYIEDVITGVGARGQRSVLQTAYGLFFCNDNGAYRYAGGQIEPISERIKVSASGGVCWSTLEDGTITDTIIKFDSLKNQVLFIGTRTDSTQKSTVWAYHVIKDRWDYWTINDLVLDGNSGAFTGKDGEIYLSIPAATYKLLRSATGLAWNWISKEFNLDNPSQNKWWGKILSDPTTGVTLTYGTEGASPTTAYTHGNNLDIYKKSLQIKLVGTAGTEVDSVEILCRKLIGLR